jgi:hypothetical protein
MPRRPDERYSEEETEHRRDAALLRALSHLPDQVDFFRGNEMRCAGVEVLLLLRRGARQCDGRRTGVAINAQWALVS